MITGGGRGIGAAIAQRFAAEGATLILTARSEDQLQEVTVLCDNRYACKSSSVSTVRSFPLACNVHMFGTKYRRCAT